MVCTMMCIACTDNNKESITRLVTEWQEREIILPDSAIFTIQGKDTVDIDMDSIENINKTLLNRLGDSKVNDVEKAKIFDLLNNILKFSNEV